MTSYFFIKDFTDSSFDDLKIYLKQNGLLYTNLELIKNPMSESKQDVKVYYSTSELEIPNLDFTKNTQFKG